jgi:hypothetical protein
VQASAFGMTLRRKQFISQREGVMLYGLVLAVGIVVIFDDLWKRSLFHFATILANIAAITRMNLGVNKYVLWSLTVITLSLLQQNKNVLSDNALLPFERKGSINITSWIFLFGGCFLKGRDNRNVEKEI